MNNTKTITTLVPFRLNVYDLKYLYDDFDEETTELFNTIPAKLCNELSNFKLYDKEMMNSFLDVFTSKKMQPLLLSQILGQIYLVDFAHKVNLDYVKELYQSGFEFKNNQWYIKFQTIIDLDIYNKNKDDKNERTINDIIKGQIALVIYDFWNYLVSDDNNETDFPIIASNRFGWSGRKNKFMNFTKKFINDQIEIFFKEKFNDKSTTMSKKEETIDCDLLKQYFDELEKTIKIGIIPSANASYYISE